MARTLVDATRPSCSLCNIDTDVRHRQFRPRIYLCGRCHKLAKRRFNTRRGRQRDRIVEVPSRIEWIETLRNAWDQKNSCFRCMLSGVPLELENAGSARYLTLEHIAPGTGHGGWLVVAAAINDMKSDFDVDEFRKSVPLLAKALDGRDSEASARLCSLLDRLKHFRRIKLTGAGSPSGIETDVAPTVTASP